MQDKKEIILSEGKKSKKNMFLIGAVVIIRAIAGFIFLKPAATGAAVLEPMDYKGIRADIVDVEAVQQGELVGISLDDLTKYKIVHFIYDDKPLMAYIDNKGSIITTIAMCEPCKNDHDFFIQDNILVCAKCWTRWKLTTHEGISGGCKNYPPVILNNEVIDNKVFVKKQDVIEWRPRV